MSTKQFQGQRDDEEVLYVFRHHPIVLRKGLYLWLIPFLLCSLPVLLWPGELKWLWVSLGGFAGGFILFFYHWIGWFFSIYIVTNQRLRQSTQQGLFGRTVVDVGLSKIQNISYTVSGFNEAVFGFGTIVIQTYVGDLVLERIMHPSKVYDKLQNFVAEHGSQDNETDYQEITT